MNASPYLEAHQCCAGAHQCGAKFMSQKIKVLAGFFAANLRIHTCDLNGVLKASKSYAKILQVGTSAIVIFDLFDLKLFDRLVFYTDIVHFIFHSYICHAIHCPLLTLPIEVYKSVNKEYIILTCL